MNTQTATKPWTKVTLTLTKPNGQLPKNLEALQCSEAIRFTKVDLVYEIEIDPSRMMNFNSMVGGFLDLEDATIVWHTAE